MTLAGKKFSLKKATIAIDCSGERQIVVFVPAKAVVNIVSEPNHPRVEVDNRMIEVVWADKRLRMFVQDILERGEESAQAALA